MSLTTEKRKRIRTLLENSSVFIEIEHSFGRQKKSVYKVNEFDEYGLSFFIPYSDGYFLTGTPLSFSLIREDYTRSRHFGVVRHYTPFYKEDGEKYFKIGVEIQSNYRDIMAPKFQLRPERFSHDGRNKPSIFCELSGESHEFELIDYSKYSAAFYCGSGDSLLFRNSTLLSKVQITLGGELLYEGSATVTKVYEDKEGKTRIVIEPRKRIIDVEKAEKLELEQTAREDTLQILRTHESFQNVDPAFKALVADLRSFLEDYKNYLESPKFKAESMNPSQLLEILFPDFFKKTDEKLVGIDRIVRKLKLSSEEHSVYRSYYQKHLLSLLLSAPINHRSYFKPSGYPGDFAIMQMIHENQFDGETFFSKLLHKYTTSIPGAQVAKKRTAYLAEQIAVFTRECKKDRVEIFSIASGPSLEIAYLLTHMSEVTDRISITLLDQEINALKFSQDRLYESRIKVGSTMQVKFIHQALGDYLRQIAEVKVGEKYDMIYAFGLFDYFDNGVGRLVIKSLLPLLNPSGQILISNASLENFDYQSYVEYGMEWYMVYRSQKDLLQLVKGLKQDYSIEITEIESGMMKFLKIKSQA